MHSINWRPLNAAYTPTVSPDPIPPRAVLTVKPRTIIVRGPIEAIAAEEAERAGITLAQILGAQRSQKYVQPRHIAMWRASRETRASLSEIARTYNRDHTSVLHALRKVEAKLATAGG
jgi:chromosomal replication initiation ATPase DnaA